MPFEIRNVSFHYDARKVIDNLSLTLESGKFYGILGPNGCGKTTFLDLLARQKEPASGKIFFMDKALSGYSKKELSKEIALVPQNFYINFPFTAEEIVMMGRYPHIPRFAAPSPTDLGRVRDIMEKTETLELKDHFVTELSGGERQRVVFARALAQDTSVLILDEATSNLDINHTISLLNLTADGVHGEKRTVIAVFQDINLAAAYCQELIFMQRGGVAASGTVDEVLTAETIRAVFNVDTKVYFEPYANARQVVFKRTPEG